MPRSEEATSAADKAACDCDPCKRKRREPNAVRSGTIHSYSSTPRGGWTARRTVAEVAASEFAPTFGVELETAVAVATPVRDLPGRPIAMARPWDADPESAEWREYRAHRAALDEWFVRNDAHRQRQYARRAEVADLTAEEAAAMAAPRGLWHSKHDGSVTGPEYASQPATLAYWRSVRGSLTGMYKALLHGGLTSHDGDTCGMHVNIGTDAFYPRDGIPGRAPRPFTAEGQEAMTEHLYRFATLIAVNPRWTTRMSQRTHDSMRQWAPIEGTIIGNSTTRRQWAESIARRGYASQNRYCALNASNDERIEFRAPRGTLRIDRFYAKLEWVAAMVEYTRDGANPVRPSDFMRWVAANDEYPALLAFMRERFAAARFGEEAAA